MLIGADYYESDEERAAILAAGGVPLGVGDGSSIENAIVDKNARIGRGVRISNKARAGARARCALRLLTARSGPQGLARAPGSEPSPRTAPTSL
jgi:hypothetical protein